MPRTQKKSFKRREPLVERPADDAPAADRTPGSSREYLRLLFSAAAELMGSEHEAEVRDFTVRVFQLSELFRAFRKSPRGKISGRQGVAAQMNLSRNAIYVWLDSLQLDAADLRSAADLTELLHKSPVLRRTIEKLLPQGLTLK